MSRRLEKDFRLSAGPDAPGAAREVFRRLRGLERDLVDDVVLIVSELVTNSVRHVTHRPGDWIGVGIDQRPHLLRVEISDPGHGFKPVQPKDERRHSGWGLVILDRLASRWGIEPGKRTRVWFEIDL
jgi:anti-sigma regulatory factor (Ser/Thr protein kinase)